MHTFNVEKSVITYVIASINKRSHTRHFILLLKLKRQNDATFHGLCVRQAITDC